ncbi:mersacidin/lichenicidin family type 2 lantibiotic [Archangium sp.]|jgi:mersacidin/lichenicidin family type 2 lantibiotic|uniref:mersacidin/lichenicidin family type 2 lantibiotic n=1 Tax=Archangium sp. TaxID=1872627 RepID=UPI00389A7BBA
MNRERIIRAWKDPEYRASLSTEERAALPECPAGRAITELHDEELAEAVGGIALTANNSVALPCRTIDTLGNSTTRYDQIP